jgi:hypothetical protein
MVDSGQDFNPFLDRGERCRDSGLRESDEQARCTPLASERRPTSISATQPSFSNQRPCRR